MSDIIEASHISEPEFLKSITDVKCQKYPELVKHLKEYAYKSSFYGLYRTFLYQENNKALAYISFAITILNKEQKTKATAQLSVPHLKYPVPVLKITRLLVSDDFTNKKIGATLLALADILGFLLSCQVGCAGLIVDAKIDATEFYRKNGFEVLQEDENNVMIKKIKTVKDYAKQLDEILRIYIEFCQNHNLKAISSYLQHIKTN